VLKNTAQGPLGIFDSGVGGLSVLREIRRTLPGEDLVYVADQAHVPYGPRTMEQVRAFSRGIVEYLLGRGAKLVVVACNTASAAALQHLRERYAEVPFVGLEPAVKPAAEKTQSGVVGVLATPATFQGELYHRTVDRFASGVTVLQDTCPGLVAQIESGQIDHPETRRILDQALQPMLARSVDRIVLGCTHYPFVIPVIREIVGPGVQIIDPAPAVARQVERVLGRREIKRTSVIEGEIQYFTTGDPTRFREMLAHLGAQPGRTGALSWSAGVLKPAGEAREPGS
jgi:glutamate racemase